MVSKTNKGARAELAAKKILEGADYLVEKVRRGKWQRQDFFGCWDICAVHRREGLLWVQVSTSPIYKRGVAYKKKLMEFPTKPGVRKEYWQYTGSGKFRIWKIGKEGVVEYD